MHISDLKIPALTKTASRMLQAELPLILLAAVVVLVQWRAEAEIDPVLAALHCGDSPFYILASAVLSVCTALLADLAERRNAG